MRSPPGSGVDRAAIPDVVEPSSRTAHGSLRGPGGLVDAGWTRADDRRTAGCAAGPNLCRNAARSRAGVSSIARWSIGFFETTPSIRRWAAGSWESPRCSASRSRCSGKGRTRRAHYVLAGRLAPALAFAALVGLVTHAAGRRWGLAAGVAAGFALLAMPRVFAHAHLAALDTFLSLFWTLALLAGDRALRARRPSSPWPARACSGRWPC